MLPIIKFAKDYEIQWKTVQLIAIEILLPITWQNGRFVISGILTSMIMNPVRGHSTSIET